MGYANKKLDNKAVFYHTVEQNQPHPMAGPCSDSCGVRLWLGALGHVLARERSRLRCPNVDRIRRRFRSSSPGCRCSRAIRGVGGQRVFLPSVPPALRPSFVWCSVEQNQPYPLAGPCFRFMRSPPMAWSARPYTCKRKIPFTVPKC